MYKGVLIINYSLSSSIELKDMKWQNPQPNNYFEYVVKFLEMNIDSSIIFDLKIKTLLSLVLENVHDHGSGSCFLLYGENEKGKVIDVYEENGGFDLKNLPNGTGGCGCREMKRNKCHISHSSDGKRTFIVVPNKNGK